MATSTYAPSGPHGERCRLRSEIEAACRYRDGVPGAECSDGEAVAVATASLRFLAAELPHGLNLPADHGLTPTAALRLCDEILRAVNLEVFELALWQSWGGTVETATGPDGTGR